MARHSKQPEPPQEAKDLSRAHAASEYMSLRHARAQRKAFIIVGVVIATLVGIVGIAFAYMMNINSRLSTGISEDLRDTLTEAEEGEPFYMLLLGIDKNESRASGTRYGSSDHAYRSDSIILARIDPVNVKVTLISIHRDTLVDLSDYGYGQEKINAAFAYGGATLAVKVIRDFAGVPISHYAEIDMDGLADVVDSVGGIDINLPVAVVDTVYAKIDLEAGEQHVDGETTVKICRARHAYDSYGDGDVYRAANQRIVIAAVLKKILASDPATMTSTITKLADMVSTDMDVTSILSLATQMSSLNVEDDVMSGMEPTEGEQINGIWYEICQVEEWQHMMERVNQGLSPYDGDSYDETKGVSVGLDDEQATSSDDTDDSDDTTTDETDSYSDSSDSSDFSSTDSDETYDTYDSYGTYTYGTST